MVYQGSHLTSAEGTGNCSRGNGVGRRTTHIITDELRLRVRKAELSASSVALGQVPSALAFCFLLREMRGLGQALSSCTRHLRVLPARCSPQRAQLTSTTLCRGRTAASERARVQVQVFGFPNPVFSVTPPGCPTLSLGPLPALKSDSLIPGLPFPG